MKLANSKYFSRSEFACKCGCGFDTVDAELLTVLDVVRENFAAPVYITSACRCYIYNHRVAGAPGSQHTKGRAADIYIKTVSPEIIQSFLEGRYPDRFGIGHYKTFTHIDTRTGPPARWKE